MILKFIPDNNEGPITREDFTSATHPLSKDYIRHLLTRYLCDMAGKEECVVPITGIIESDDGIKYSVTATGTVRAIWNYFISDPISCKAVDSVAEHRDPDQLEIPI